MVQGPPELNPPPAAMLVVRFGLPLVVGIHYLTAARGFAFTPDAAFGSASASLLVPAGGGGALAAGFFSPLWALLLGAGASLGLEPLMTAKILSLVFSSLGVIAVYLLAVEVLGDRILAFLAALAGGLEPWLLAAAPAGTPHSLLFALSYASCFFLRRGDVAIGGILIGLAGAAAWPAFGLLLVLATEVLTNNATEHRRQTIMAGILLTGATLAASAFFSGTRLIPIFSGPEVPGIVVPASWHQGGLLLAAAVAAWWGWRSLRRFPILRLVFPGSWIPIAGFILWGTVCAVAFSSSYLLLLGPACVILILDGIRKSFVSMYKEPISYAPALVGVALIIVIHQVAYFTSVKPAMGIEAEAERETEAIAAWLRTNAAPHTEVGAEPAGRLGFLLRSDLPVERVSRDNPQYFIVGRSSPGTGYAEAYRPSAGTGLAVFKRISGERQQ